jgi:hypothetical protein
LKLVEDDTKKLPRTTDGKKFLITENTYKQIPPEAESRNSKHQGMVGWFTALNSITESTEGGIKLTF